MARRGSGETARAREMRRMLGRWERSGLTQAEFALRHGITPGALRWWRHTLRGSRQAPIPDETGSPTKFVEIVRHPESLMAHEARTLEVVLRSGHAMQVPEGMSAGWLGEVVRALEGESRSC